METRLMLAQFAGQGYALLAADYFGKGESPEKDSYLVKLSAQQACLDMLLAAQAVSAELKIHWGPLFLSGWSQGGWATMVFLNKLESVGLSVRAAATASAPEDLFAIINRWIHAHQDTDATFLPALLALQLNAYEEYYGLPGLARSLIKTQYQSAARNLYLNQITWEQASSQLPKQLSELLDEDCIAASSIGNTRYWEIVQNNQAYRWRSKTPLRSYYGDADEVIPPYIATLPVGYQKIIGGAETVSVEVTGKANHRGTFVYAVADEKKWFDELIRQSSVP
jgi:pimeloyl-ACP methyl ester carboxylesterase